jgi:hypothetical protein
MSCLSGTSPPVISPRPPGSRRRHSPKLKLTIYNYVKRATPLELKALQNGGAARLSGVRDERAEPAASTITVRSDASCSRCCLAQCGTAERVRLSCSQTHFVRSGTAERVRLSCSQTHFVRSGTAEILLTEIASGDLDCEDVLARFLQVTLPMSVVDAQPIALVTLRATVGRHRVQPMRVVGIVAQQVGVDELVDDLVMLIHTKRLDTNMCLPRDSIH